MRINVTTAFEVSSMLLQRNLKTQFYYYGYTFYPDTLFETALPNQSNLKTPGLRFSVDRTHFLMELFETNGVTIIMLFP